MEKTREYYLGEVKKWSMLMLTTVRSLPNTAEKLTLLNQVNKLKDAHRIKTSDLPAYAGALAVLSNKATQLLSGEDMNTSFTRESIARLLRSDLMRNMMEKDHNQFIKLNDFLVIKSKAPSSETLTRLSRSGH
ncbi:hypothetical protein MNBD_NITROSPINAE01-1191 [hydrothermal vent metagenome]|uniref:Uncharacterized protein n=1 Tax=hydrothermal vent metagenome TaxID=652676 RepID=A0A3B1C239_9ZZZZ